MFNCRQLASVLLTMWFPQQCMHKNEYSADYFFTEITHLMIPCSYKYIVTLYL